MRISKTRNALAALLAGALLVPALAAATPAVATEDEAVRPIQCIPLPGNTPSVEIDEDDDGNPEHRVPSISNVELCVEDTVVVTAPTVYAEPCSWGLGCWAIRIHAHASLYADTGLLVCYLADDVRSCSTANVAPVSAGTPPVSPICIGIDLGGQYPCSGWYLTFE